MRWFAPWHVVPADALIEGMNIKSICCCEAVWHCQKGHYAASSCNGLLTMHKMMQTPWSTCRQAGRQVVQATSSTRTLHVLATSKGIA
jgi:hypothetical protein